LKPSAISAGVNDMLERARRAASQIAMKNNAGAQLQQSTQSILAGKHSQPLLSSKVVADHLAAQLNAKLNYQPLPEAPSSDLDKASQFQKYEEELLINDFPQQAR
jgi:hypothetical protein